MIGNAVEHRGLADAAVASLAVMHRVLAGLDQHVEDGLAGGNLVDAAVALELDLEACVAGLFFGCGEDFEMQPSLLPVQLPGERDGRFDHRQRTAKIERHIGRKPRHQSLEIEHAARFVVGMNGLPLRR